MYRPVDQLLYVILHVDKVVSVPQEWSLTKSRGGVLSPASVEENH